MEDLEILPALDSRAPGLRQEEQEYRVHELLLQLFDLHDLDGDGALQESELISLNEQIAVLHHGVDADLESVRQKYRGLFREYLHPKGYAVSCEEFCTYARQVLNGLDTDLVAQEMILEQWSAEARTCRQLFPSSCDHRTSTADCLGSPASAKTSVPAESDHDLPSTVDGSLTDIGTDSDSDLINLGVGLPVCSEHLRTGPQTMGVGLIEKCGKDPL